MVRSAKADGVLPASQGGAKGECLFPRADQGNDRGEPVIRFSDGRSPVGFQQEHSAADLPAQRLASKETPRGLSAASASVAFGSWGP